MKTLLLQAYLKRQQDCLAVKNRFPDDDLAGPLLMSPNALYSESSNPLLIVGQETKGWNYFSDDFEKQMKVYEDFNVGEEYYASPFWNVTRKLEKAVGNLPYSCAWTNISKFDLEGGRSYGEHEAAISRLDDLLVAELEIIKPKVCVFFSGPNFDHRLKKIFPSVEYQTVDEWPTRELSQLNHPLLPNLTFRTYHPRYLRMNGLEEDFINIIKKMAFGQEQA